MSKLLTWTDGRRWLGDLRPYADNPRRIGEEQGKRLVRSKKKFAQLWPIIIGPEGELLAQFHPTRGNCASPPTFTTER